MPYFDNYTHIAVIVLMVLVVAVGIFHLYRKRKKRNKEKARKNKANPPCNEVSIDDDVHKKRDRKNALSVRFL